MKRREFITLVGGAAAWPVGAWAQQVAMPVVGYLMAASLEPTELAALRKGLTETGFVEGRNVAVEYRFANNDYKLLAEMASELVGRRVNVIIASGGVIAARIAKAATTSIPIVGAVSADPVVAGLVESLSRPGGNFTGVAFLTTELGPKRVSLLKELVPGARRYAVLVNPSNPATASVTAELQSAAAAANIDLEVFAANDNREIDVAFSAIVKRNSDALIVGASSLFNSRRVQIATLAAMHRLPTIYYDRKAVEVGGLISYGASIIDATHQAGIYVGRILKGEKPSELPVAQSSKFELVLNLQTARSLGISVPASLLASADEVIE